MILIMHFRLIVITFLIIIILFLPLRIHQLEPRPTPLADAGPATAVEAALADCGGLGRGANRRLHQ